MKRTRQDIDDEGEELRNRKKQCMPPAVWENMTIPDTEGLILEKAVESPKRRKHSTEVDIVALIRLRLVCRNFKKKLDQKYAQGEFFALSDRASWCYWLSASGVNHPSLCNSIQGQHWRIEKKLPLIIPMMRGAIFGGKKQLCKEIIKAAFSSPAFIFTADTINQLLKACTPSTVDQLYWLLFTLLDTLPDTTPPLLVSNSPTCMIQVGNCIKFQLDTTRFDPRIIDFALKHWECTRIWIREKK